MSKTGSKRYPTAAAKRRRRPLNNPKKQPKTPKTGIPLASIKITPQLQTPIDQKTLPTAVQVRSLIGK